MQDNSFRHSLKGKLDWALRYVTTAMAVIMIAYSVIGCYNNLEYRGIFLTIAIFILPFICGVLIILDKHRSIFFAVGLYAIALGFSRLIKYGSWLYNNDDIHYAAGLILSIMALNMMYSGYRYIRNNSRSILYIIIGTSLFTFLLATDVVLGIRSAESTEEFIEMYSFDVVTLVMYLFYLGLVWSEQIRNSTDLYRMNRSFSGLRMSEGSGPNVKLDREVAEHIRDFCNNNISEEDLKNVGPVTAEYCFEYRDALQTGYGMVQRWNRGSDEFYLYLSDHDEGSLIFPKCTRIKQASMISNMLILSSTTDQVCIFHLGHKNEHDGPVLYREEREETEVED